MGAGLVAKAVSAPLQSFQSPYFVNSPHHSRDGGITTQNTKSILGIYL